jgi:hypothetical protein
MSKTFDFNAQLGLGNLGELDFSRYYVNEKPVKSTDLAYDFLLGNGKKVEVKTDSYSMDRTGNFFMELYSDVRRMTLGGPWRAANDNVDLFVYYFQPNKTFFWFEPKTLCQELEKAVFQYHFPIRTIRNKSWETQGYAIPRDILTPLKKDQF